jgi:hypothetical protein
MATLTVNLFNTGKHSRRSWNIGLNQSNALTVPEKKLYMPGMGTY